MTFGQREAVRIDRIDDTRTGARAGMKPAWRTLAPESRCQIIECRAEEVLQSQALQMRTTHKVLFRKTPRDDAGRALYLNDKHRLAWTDREGQTRYLRVVGATKPPGPGLPHAVRCVEITEGQT